MTKVLIVTNDFPPRQRRDPVVRARACQRGCRPTVSWSTRPAWEGAAEFDARQPFPVIRHPTSLMLPVPSVARAGPRAAGRARLRHRAVRRGRAARPAGPAAAPGRCRADRRRSPTATRLAGPRCPAPGHCCGASATRSTSLTYLGGVLPDPAGQGAVAAGRRPHGPGWRPAWTPAAFRPGAGGAAIRQRPRHRAGPARSWSACPGWCRARARTR